MSNTDSSTKHPEITGFISYRRIKEQTQPSPQVIDIVNTLSEDFGYDIFFDQDMKMGLFSAQIHHEIDRREFLFLILEEHTFKPERLRQPNDWVRRELEYAKLLNRNIVIISNITSSWETLSNTFNKDDHNDEQIRDLLKYLSKQSKINKQDRDYPYDKLQEIVNNIYDRNRHIYLCYAAEEEANIENKVEEFYRNNSSDTSRVSKSDEADVITGLSKSIKRRINKPVPRKYNFTLSESRGEDSDTDTILKCNIMILLLTKRSYIYLQNEDSRFSESVKKAFEQGMLIIPISYKDTYISHEDVPHLPAALQYHQTFAYGTMILSDFVDGLLNNIKNHMFAGSMTPISIHKAQTSFFQAKSLHMEGKFEAADIQYINTLKWLPIWGAEYNMSREETKLARAQCLLDWSKAIYPNDQDIAKEKRELAIELLKEIEA